MKKKDFIKLSLLDKTIDHEKIINTILTEPEENAPAHRPRSVRGKRLAAAACVLLLAVSVSLPLTLGRFNAGEVSEQSVNSLSGGEESAPESGSGISGTVSEIQRKIVYGTNDSIETDDMIYYKLGTLRIHPLLDMELGDPENDDAFFAVSLYYMRERRPGDPELPDYYKKALEDHDYSRYSHTVNKFTEYKYNIFFTELAPRISRNEIPNISNELFINLTEECKRTIGALGSPDSMPAAEYQKRVTDIEFDYAVKQLDLYEIKPEERDGFVNQLDLLRTEAREAIDAYYAAEKVVDEYEAEYGEATRFVRLAEYFESQGLNYRELLDRNGENEGLLLTREEILSLTVAGDERLGIYLFCEDGLILDDA